MASSDSPPPPGKPPLPWRVRLLVGAASFLHSASLRADGTVNRSLLSLFERTVPPSPAPDAAGVSSTDHAVSSHLRVRLFVPAPAASGSQLPVVVYFHGGGFVLHSVATAQFDALCRRLAASIPAVVASVDYRLAPEHCAPSAYDDGEAALRWALAGAGGALPSPPTAVFVAGDSAGGNVAHHVAARLQRSVAGLVLLQPFFGGEAQTASERRLRHAPFGAPERLAWLWRAFLPPGATRDHEWANVPAAIQRDGAARGSGARSRRRWCAWAGGTCTRTGRGSTRTRCKPPAPRRSASRSSPTPSTRSTCSRASRTGRDCWPMWPSS